MDQLFVGFQLCVSRKDETGSFAMASHDLASSEIFHHPHVHGLFPFNDRQRRPSGEGNPEQA